MLDRNAEISRNTEQVLQHRKDELQRRRAELQQRIAVDEARLAEFSQSYERNLSSARWSAIVSARAPRWLEQVLALAAKARAGPEDLRFEARRFGQAFFAGFIVSLAVGLALFVAR